MKFGNSVRICTFVPGELAEWSIAAVLKTVELLKVPGVRIPSSPHMKNAKGLLRYVEGFFVLEKLAGYHKWYHFQLK
ncbi:hypothetical protein A0256_13715 [Mucilaginibacter sp. PAMC 26640]|nr:hypothetical protein A0256_13715 [Mucilaginibacter sp. PAMC 26640]